MKKVYVSDWGEWKELCNYWEVSEKLESFSVEDVDCLIKNGGESVEIIYCGERDK